MRIRLKEKNRLGLRLWIPNRLFLSSLTAQIIVRAVKEKTGIELDREELLRLMEELRRLGKRCPKLELVDISTQDGTKVRLRL